MNKKAYRIRDKRTNEFVTLGHNHKKIWNTFPAAVIKSDQESRRVLKDLNNYEVVVFELKEIGTLPIK